MKICPPKHLSPAARRIFRQIVDEYDIRDSGGLRVLTAGLTALDRAESARKQIDADGMLIADRWGQRKPHPLIPAERDARAQWLQSLKLLDLDIGGAYEKEAHK